MSKLPLPEQWKPYFEKARAVRANAYAPYSNCQVGACITLKNGESFVGCNVENSSIGATVCAERGAIQTAIATHGKSQVEIHHVVVVSDAQPAWMPCGLCRQVLSEFGLDFKVIAVNLQGEWREITFRELYPASFTSDEMNAQKS